MNDRERAVALDQWLRKIRVCESVSADYIAAEFAAVRADERERCAKVADGFATSGHSRNPYGGDGPCPFGPYIAAAIRAMKDEA